ncbi:MAG: SDR family oxidoreductase [Thermoanaerobaculia bacterium]|nr:SDR family oxidoreductase [Thermoanaerobaculia bacterium]
MYSQNSEADLGTLDGSGRVALVTGGSRGIGRAVVEALLRRHWIVALCGKSQQSVEKTLRALAGVHESRVEGRSVDVGNQQQVDSWVRDVADRHGRIDLVVNNAGLGRFAPVDELDGDDWRDQLRTNLDGAFYMTRAAAQVMKERGEGWILNVASLAARHSFAGGTAYNASKFGLLGFSDAAMLDLRHHGIKVVAILPGSVDTSFHSEAHPEQATSENDWMLRPEDVARAVVDVLSYPERALPSRIELRPTRPKR